MDELMICVAPQPGERPEKSGRKMDVPNEVYRSFNEGASIVHLHVRDEWGNQVANTAFFRKNMSLFVHYVQSSLRDLLGGLPKIRSWRDVFL